MTRRAADRFVSRFLIAASLLALPQVRVQAVLIPATRLTRWIPGVTVGVPGGMRLHRSHVVDVTKAPYDADPTGTKDCSGAILAAIEAAPPGGVIYLPAGYYLVENPIAPHQGKSNYTIRGAGDTSVINWAGKGIALFNFGSGSDYQWNYPAGGVAITGGLVQGSTVLTVASTLAVIDGGMIQISEKNDAELPVIHVSGYPNKRTQKVKVVSHTGTTITIAPGLLWTLQRGLNPIFNVAQFQSNGVGIENLSIDDHLSTSPFVILFDQCYGSWIYNVHSRLAYNYHIYLADCLQCQVEHCYLDQLNHTGSNGTALLVQATSGSLIQNNIITRAVSHVALNFGSCGNVFAYNFCYDSFAFGVVGASIDSNHGPHSSYNLYEGNIAPNIQCDGYFGGASEDTVFRNWFFGTAPGVTTVVKGTTVLAAREPVLLQRFTRNYNVIGNLLGTKGSPYISISGVAAAGGPYSFGLPNLGNTVSVGIAQPSAGNYWKDWYIHGTLTSATNANGGANTNTAVRTNTGVVTFIGDAGDLSPSFDQATISWDGGQQINLVIGSVTATTLSFSGGGGSLKLPAIGTPIQIWPGPGGYQEKDLDVQASLDLKANYDVFNQVEPAADQKLGADALPDSFYLRKAPSWFGNLPWPAVNSVRPYTSSVISGATGSTGLPLGFEAIPAGYRYVHGEDPPAVSHGKGQ
jgi:hypothetical protein